MNQSEKVINGLECCSQMAGEMRRNCPYANECEEGEGLLAGAAHLAADALALLKAQEPHVIIRDDFSRCDDFGYIPAVFEPRDMTNFTNWEWYLVTINDLLYKGGRYWSGLPTDEQREAVKWNG